MADRESMLLVSGLPQLEFYAPARNLGSEEGIKPKQNKNIAVVELNRP